MAHEIAQIRAMLAITAQRCELGRERLCHMRRIGKRGIFIGLEPFRGVKIAETARAACSRLRAFEDLCAADLKDIGDILLLPEAGEKWGKAVKPAGR